ncbi:mitotic checkpoint regulator, MAD2B-interacting-domain-containing protein [Lophiotrema nucula]|uniref:Mitotic checkpoint regulator, MAD2B-interacting-domain-containing protein n=1 Tax=Lophiotrema nucula TaxID=690887 RepID=A0A6A5Z1R5_9PLEO|nr:mitotic checkpoint regulator, MAD2B-interacting-domain-containing protein [Lophiotrema nucula]
MNLLGYSDSEGSDDDAPQAPRPAAKPAPKPSFQKVIDRSQPGKIKLNLPAPTQQKANKDDIEADAPPAKKQRTGGGAFGGFNAMLPAPKKANATVPAAPETGEEGAMLAGKRGPSPSPAIESPKAGVSNVEADAKPAKKPVKFMPLSVARGKKKRPAIAAAPVPIQGETKSSSGQSAVNSTPAARPKVSLFGAAQPDQGTTLAGASGGEYKPLLHGQEEDEEEAGVPDEAFDQTNGYEAQSHQALRAAPTGQQNLTDIAAELNLSESERRQLFGRRGRGDHLSGVNIVDFNIDREYAHNEEVRQQGETVQHNALKSISGTGKNSLRSLINVAVTQKDALEDHFAQGKKNKREAGSKYGW